MANNNVEVDIEEIIDEMYDLLDKAPSVPFAQHKTVIDGERMKDLLNDIRLNMPQEIKRAKLIDFDCERIMKEAEEKAEIIIRRAEDRAKAIVSNDAIIKEAKQKALDMLTKAQATAKEIVGKAEDSSRNIKNATSEYVNNILSEAEKSLQDSLQDINRTTAQIRRAKSAKAVKVEPQKAVENPQ